MRFVHFVCSSTMILLLAVTTACTDVIRRPAPSTPEEDYCTRNETFSTFYTIQGDAKFEVRDTTASGLGAINATPLPIRRAEVQVLNSSGEIVQCTETDASGHYTFTIPNDNSVYTVKVNSRSYNAYSKVSVLTNSSDNQYYSISGTFTANANKTLSDLIAQADDNDLRAGAFNILDQIYKANDYLLNNTSGAFTVTHKARAYWTKGSSVGSYYIPGSDQLFILGGEDGDVATSDTDHFDNSVIVHEYGHFLEDNYSVSDSPGGVHYGTFAIDPRLAWSEGFSNYFSAKVLGDPIYRDTYGYDNSGGSSGTGFGYYYNMQTNSPSKDLPTPGSLGEGGFRELAISRFLWAATNGIMPFSELWSIYTNGFKNTTPFREMSLFLKRQDLDGTTDISALYPNDLYEMDETRLHYGTEDNTSTANVASSASCRWTIQASAKLPSTAGSSVFDRSNQYYSNDFYYFYHPGGTLGATLNYDLTATTTADLDLYIYKNDYSFGVGSDMLTYSNRDKSVDNGTESITSAASAGHYMINVMYYNDGAGSPATTYNLIINNNLICK